MERSIAMAICSLDDLGPQIIEMAKEDRDKSLSSGNELRMAEGFQKFASAQLSSGLMPSLSNIFKISTLHVLI